MKFIRKLKFHSLKFTKWIFLKLRLAFKFFLIFLCIPPPFILLNSFEKKNLRFLIKSWDKCIVTMHKSHLNSLIINGFQTTSAMYMYLLPRNAIPWRLNDQSHTPRLLHLNKTKVQITILLKFIYTLGRLIFHSHVCIQMERLIRLNQYYDNSKAYNLSKIWIKSINFLKLPLMRHNTN